MDRSILNILSLSPWLYLISGLWKISLVTNLCPEGFLIFLLVVIFIHWNYPPARMPVTFFPDDSIFRLGNPNWHPGWGVHRIHIIIIQSRWCQLHYFSFSPQTLGKISSQFDLRIFSRWVGWFNHQAALICCWIFVGLVNLHWLVKFLRFTPFWSPTPCWLAVLMNPES